jgi:hypothetical protein
MAKRDNVKARTSGGTTKAAAMNTPSAAAPPIENTGRSGGVVDAPGKKHRKPLPSDPGAKIVSSQAAKMRTATPMAKTNRRRGRA